MEKISYIFYRILKTFDFFIEKIFKKSFLIYFNDFLNNDKRFSELFNYVFER